MLNGPPAALRAIDARYPPGLLPSVMVLGVVVAFALAGLVSVGNWPEVLRVAAAATPCWLGLLALSRRQPGARIGAFVDAGAAAGIVSGLVRPTISLAVLAAGMIGAGLLPGPLHWLAIRSWSRR
jgi:hypothetical protein